MGRVSKEQAALNRKRVVEAASRLFRKEGTHKTSIADVMTAADLTVGGFYKQFESKESLVDEAWEHAFVQSSNAWDSLLEKAGMKHVSGLKALIQHYFSSRPREKSCPILVFAPDAENQQAGVNASDIYSEGVEALYGQFRKQVADSLPADVDQKQVDARALQLFAAMVGVGMLTRAIGQTPFIRQLQDAVLASVPEGDRTT